MTNSIKVKNNTGRGPKSGTYERKASPMEVAGGIIVFFIILLIIGAIVGPPDAEGAHNTNTTVKHRVD